MNEVPTGDEGENPGEELAEIRQLHGEDTSTDPTEAPVSNVDVVKYLFHTDRQKTQHGRLMDQLTISEDSATFNVNLGDPVATGDYFQFIVNDAVTTYKALLVLAYEIDKLQSSNKP